MSYELNQAPRRINQPLLIIAVDESGSSSVIETGATRNFNRVLLIAMQDDGVLGTKA